MAIVLPLTGARRCLQDLFDGIDNDALLINDCNDNQMPHHWLGDGYCDDGSDLDDGIAPTCTGGATCPTRFAAAGDASAASCPAGCAYTAAIGGDFNCNIFLCDDSDCGSDCRIVTGRDQVYVAADMGTVYGNVRDANGEAFEADFEAGETYYIWTTVGNNAGHIQDTTLTLFDSDGTTTLAQNDDGPYGPFNSYIEFTPAEAISAATIQVNPKSRSDRGTFMLQISTTRPTEEDFGAPQGDNILATCGDADGMGPGEVAVTDAQCGGDLVANPAAVQEACAGTECDLSLAEDKAVCCMVRPVLKTCGNVNGDSVSDDPFDCSRSPNSLRDAPDTFTCDRDCVASECCTVPRIRTCADVNGDSIGTVEFVSPAAQNHPVRRGLLMLTLVSLSELRRRGEHARHGSGRDRVRC